MAVPTLRVRGRTRPVAGTLVMGVVNASPESFSDAGRYRTLDSRLALADRLVEQGCEIVDIGGQSAITNVAELDAQVESDRVVPIVEWVRRHHPDVLISVDTYKPDVVRDVLAAGADIINDVSGLRDPEVAQRCAAADAALVIMHTKAAPKQRFQHTDAYRDVVGEVDEFLAGKLDEATALGLDREALILDPGPDFAKTPHQTVQLLRGIDRFRRWGRPLLLALSRKDFLGAILDRPPLGRDAGTIAAIAHIAATPGNIVRVHDVTAARDAIRTVETLAGRHDIPADYRLPDAIRTQPPEGHPQSKP